MGNVGSQNKGVAKWAKKKGFNKLAIEHSDQALKQSQQAGNLVLETLGLVKNFEERVKNVERAMALNDWKTAAIIEFLVGGLGITKEQFLEKVREIQIQDFEQKSEQHDRDVGLVPTDEEPQEGFFAIFGMRLFRDGRELTEQRVVRSKVLLGQAEILEEIDFALLGMKPGETVSLNTEILQQECAAEITLYGLRKQLPKAPPAPEESEPSEQSAKTE
jgi:hypothetical protein